MSSATSTAWQTMEVRVLDNWSGDDSAIAWAGVDFKPPDGPWLRPTPLFGASEYLTMGGTGAGQNLLTGILDLDVFDKPGEGYATIRGYADTLRDAFDRVLDGTVQFGTVSGPRVLNTGDGWIGLKVSVPFTIEETT